MTGSGTQADPYIISDADDLQAMENDLSAYYELGKNINASATLGWNGGLGFDPVGDLADPFTGHLDGKHFNIFSLYINRNESYVGLFGNTQGPTITIDNLGIVDCSISGPLAGEVACGALCGRLYGATISQCFSTGSVEGNFSVGGLIGISQSSTTNNCYSRASVTGNRYAGGFAGRNWIATLNKSYSTGLVTCPTDAGGFLGNAQASSTVTACFWDTETSGQAASDGGTGKNTAEMKTESTFTDASWDFDTIWLIDGVTNDGYPYFGTKATATYPSDALARVSSIRHIFQPGLFRMRVGVGDLGFDIDVAEAAIRKIVAAEVETGKLPKLAPKTIECPPGQHMFYDAWDVDKQYPYCVVD